MTAYNITIEITQTRDYGVTAETMDEAHTLALERAIQEFPGADVYIRGSRKPELSREQRLQQAKDRALAYLDRGNLLAAFTSMLEDTIDDREIGVNPFVAEVGLLRVHDPVRMREWIEGFN